MLILCYSGICREIIENIGYDEVGGTSFEFP
jgi:hypothetical protein